MDHVVLSAGCSDNIFEFNMYKNTVLIIIVMKVSGINIVHKDKREQ